ncbi:MAG: histidinol-phosphate transaminase [Eubacteriales bacterium]|nr:histidinol-phosphate transaminase [Eubacteriales bacterium]
MKGYEVERAAGMPLNANEDWRNLPETLVRKIAAAVTEVAFNRYPDNDATDLRAAYAVYLGVQPTEVAVGNGSDELLGLMIGLFCGRGTLMTMTPDFSMYDYYVRFHGGTVEKYDPTTEGMAGFIRRIRKTRPQAAVFSNPNNPTGHLYTRDEVQALLQAVPDIPIIVDEAYMEFSDESVVDCINRYPNLYVTRTLSKAMGAAAIRVGAVASGAENISYLNRLRVPYTVNRMSQAAGVAILSEQALLQERITETIAARDALRERLAGANFRRLAFTPSGGNFIYGRALAGQDVAAAFQAAGYAVRVFPDGGFRITVADAETNERIFEILQMVEEAV